MRRYLGRLIGAAVGVSGGWYGVVVGFLIGTLVDHLFQSRLENRRVEAFLFGTRPPRISREKLELWSLAALAARVSTLGGAPTDRQMRELRRYLGRQFDLGGLDELLDEVILYPESVSPEVMVAHWSEVGSGRKLWREEVICWLYELAGERPEGISPAVRSSIREVASLMGLSEEQVGGIEREAPFLEAEAAALLGVPRSADRQELRKVYRRLAAQFHPDTARTLAEEQRRTSEGAFLRIREAYERLMRHLDELDR